MKIHLTAICGTFMGSLASLLKAAGHEVRGSDQGVYPPMSEQLAAQEIAICEGYAAENLDWGPEFVVIGNAVSRDNPEARAVLERGIEYTSGADALRRFFLKGRHPVVVAGTHGKSTTSALLAWILESAGKEPSFLVGAVPRNFGLSARIGRGEHFVVEGDEYDTAFFDKEAKFLHYAPRTAILTSVEFDHADIFADMDAVRAEFEKFVRLVPPEGTLVACGDDPMVRQVVPHCPGRVYAYGVSEEVSEWSGRILEVGPKGAHIEVRWEGRPWAEAQSPLWGHHNLSNQVATAAVAHCLGLGAAAWAKGIESFQGVRRRQEVRGVSAGGVTVIDDFAHHPTAVSQTLRALRQGFSQGRLWAVFEPRTNTTRRSVFQEAYAESFAGADQIVVAAVDHPEKAPEGDRFDAERLVCDLQAQGLDAVYVPAVDEIVSYLAVNARKGDVVAVLSNGAFGGICGKLLAALP